MNVKIILLRPNAVMPQYQTSQSAAMDLHACIDAPLSVAPHQRVMVPTGIAIELPDGYEAQVRARSGLSIKHGITMANGVGTIDSDFRGEITALVINTSDQTFVIEPDMRIAQLVVARYEKVVWEQTTTLDDTDRASGGYGSTGLQK